MEEEEHMCHLSVYQHHPVGSLGDMACSPLLVDVDICAACLCVVACSQMCAVLWGVEGRCLFPPPAKFLDFARNYATHMHLR